MQKRAQIALRPFSQKGDCMKKIVNAIHRFEDMMLILILSYILIMVLVGVVLRYVFSYSIFGSDEIIGYLIVCLGMLGSAVTIRDDSNICLDSVIKMVSREKQKWIYIPIQIMIAAILVFYICCSFHMTFGNMDVLAPMSRISMALPYGAMTASLVFMLFEHIYLFVRKIKNHCLYWATTDYENQ